MSCRDRGLLNDRFRCAFIVPNQEKVGLGIHQPPRALRRTGSTSTCSGFSHTLVISSTPRMSMPEQRAAYCAQLTTMQMAAIDNNANTEPDASWLPLSTKTAPDPSYPCAHSATSTAAAEVLRLYLGDRMTFDVTPSLWQGSRVTLPVSQKRRRRQGCVEFTLGSTSALATSPASV